MNVESSTIEAARAAVPGPPRPPFVLSVGVTGHRAEVLPPGALPALRERIREILVEIAAAGHALYERERACFSDDKPHLRFVSPIADGTDQIAAEVALDLGWELQVIVPFGRQTYRRSLANHKARKGFDTLLERAQCVLELPGDRRHGLEAYVMTGRATVAHCDMLIAVWDGLPPRGRGGTGEVVQIAITHGTAVIHVMPDLKTPTRVLWSAFDPTVLTVADDPGVERPLARPDVDAMLRGLLLPPPNPKELQFLERFHRERLRKLRARFEYPLLLTAAGVRRIKSGDIYNKRCADAIRDEWDRYRRGCPEALNIAAPINLLQDAYSWADSLATHFAQTYRGGHIFNFVLGAVAVCMGLGTLMAPELQFDEAVVEMIITLSIILNSILGTRQEWHRRWLDYRQLAERLRPMRSLKLLGIAAPDPPGTTTNPVPRRWIDWYASAIWRAMGCPSGSIDRGCAARMGEAIAEHEIAPQVEYHKRNAELIELLDHRLEEIGLGLFGMTLVISVATLIGFALDASYVETYDSLFMLIQAGFPALGTAVFGIRFQGDFGGDALRSLATADTLGQIDHELRQQVSLTRAADLAEQASRIMLSDLDEWRLINQQRDLSVG